MRPRRFLASLSVPLLLVAAGTIGYCVIEGWSILNSLYMTITTPSTVRFQEVHLLSTAGRVFTMVLILGGVFTLFYAATATIAAIASGEARAFVEKQLPWIRSLPRGDRQHLDQREKLAQGGVSASQPSH